MAYDAGDEFRRPVTLALASVAIIGWLLAAFCGPRRLRPKTG